MKKLIWGYTFSILISLQILIGCSNSDSKIIFFKSKFRDQLKERAIKKCHGDFIVLEEQKFGPYTRAFLNCPK